MGGPSGRPRHSRPHSTVFHAAGPTHAPGPRCVAPGRSPGAASRCRNRRTSRRTARRRGPVRPGPRPASRRGGGPPGPGRRARSCVGTRCRCARERCGLRIALLTGLGRHRGRYFDLVVDRGDVFVDLLFRLGVGVAPGRRGLLPGPPRPAEPRPAWPRWAPRRQPARHRPTRPPRRIPPHRPRPAATPSGPTRR